MSEEIKNALKFAEENGIESCDFCRYSDDCKRGVTPDGSGNPCYPPCADGDPDFWVDEDSLLEHFEEFKEVST